MTDSAKRRLLDESNWGESNYTKHSTGYSRSNDKRIYFEGLFRLGSAEAYAPINALLNKTIEDKPTQVTLDFRACVLFDDSGTNALFKFALEAKKQTQLKVVVNASRDSAWQLKTLPSLTKLNPRVQMTLVD